MWHSATASAVALLEQHNLLFGGLGGIIAVIVGGVVSVITLRNARRSVARPMPSPQPAPASRRPPPPPMYGEPAPPTSPARRLHPGPISLSTPAAPQPEHDDADSDVSLFNPDILAGDHDADPEDTLAELAASAPMPVLRPNSSFTAEWRAQAAPVPVASLTHAPIWNREPFAQLAQLDDASGTLREAEISLAIAPPVWRTGVMSERLPFADAPAELAPHTPIWRSWLVATPDNAPDAAPRAETLSDADDAESAPPIWPSFLRPA